MRFADLHIHSCYSDGDSSVEDIVKDASKAGLDCISITDHDTLDAYQDKELLATLSREYGIEILKGVEFSANWGNAEIHLLGYFPNGEVNDFFYDVLKQVKEARYDRILRMIALLKDLGVEIDLDEFKQFMGTSSPSRLHVAVFLCNKGLVTSISDAFRRYLGYGKPAYTSRFQHNTKEAVNILKDAGARVLLAHPVHIRDFNDLAKFLDLGVEGLEVFYPAHPDNLIIKYNNFVETKGLLATGGSDYHGSYKEHIELGCIKLPYSYVEQLKGSAGLI